MVTSILKREEIRIAHCLVRVRNDVLRDQTAPDLAVGTVSSKDANGWGLIYRKTAFFCPLHPPRGRLILGSSGSSENLAGRI
jgi:hypothetical protein